MPQIKVDGRVCAFEGKKSILQVALAGGVEIPHYCWHPGMSVVASCRICLVEAASPDPKTGALNLIPKLVPACQTPAVDGMEVYLKTPKVLGNQKAVMEFLLINHPLDCPVCDQAGECSLQDYSYKYGRSESRFEEAKNKKPKKDIGPHVLLYSDRCIMCTRCVRFTQEVTGSCELGVYGRGSSEQIDVGPGQPLDNPLSGNVVDICPVGALLDKDFLMTMRVWNLTKRPTIDGLTASGDNLSVESNEGRVCRVKPRTNMAVNKWWTSDEIRYGWKFAHREDRLREPFRNGADGPRTLDWAEALAQAQEGVKAALAGGGQLAVVVSPMLPTEEAYLLGELALALDPRAILAVGPVPTEGADQTFPGGYKIHAEKAPNARGVRRALEAVVEQNDVRRPVLPFEALDGEMEGVRAVIVCGNYPSGSWADERVVRLLQGRFSVLLDTLPSAASAAASLVLPGATWLEKSGSFENAAGLIQSFPAVIPVLEMARPEGQTALDLLAVAEGTRREIYDAAAVRAEIGGPTATEVRHPVEDEGRVSDIAYAAV